MAHMASGYCSNCGESDVETADVNDSWMCRGCVFEKASGPGLVIAGEIPCASCGDNVDHTDVYCSSCNACEESHSEECSECYNTAEFCSDHANRTCQNCGNFASISSCGDCQSCNSCGNSIVDEGGGWCEDCHTESIPAKVPSVISDDGSSINVEGLEVNWS